MIEFTKDSLDEAIKSNKTVIVDFWAPWCGPCRALGPILEEEASNHNDILFGKVNVDNEEELASRYNIQSIPFVIKFKDGHMVDSFLGLKDSSFVKDFFLK